MAIARDHLPPLRASAADSHCTNAGRDTVLLLPTKEYSHPMNRVARTTDTAGLPWNHSVDFVKITAAP